MGGQETWGPIAIQAALQEHIDPYIFLAMIEKESRWDENAVSHDGAVGLMQIMPWAHPDVNPRNTRDAIFWAASAIRKYREERGSYEMALAAYNVGGPGTASWRSVPQWEMDRYVTPILRRAAELQAADAPVATPVFMTTAAIADTPTPSSPLMTTPTPTPPVITPVLLCALVFFFLFSKGTN